MTLTFRNGNMFDEPGEAIVNTVNCVGVMGKGVALEFKKRWPANFAAYRSMCRAGRLRPGRVFIHANAEMLDTDGRRFLINFPTKDHWRAKSRMEFISEGLDDLVAQIAELRIEKVVMPPLGCGNGGLDWSEVRDVIVQKLGKIEDVEFVVYAPSESGESRDRVATPRPASGMTFERALLIRALDRLAPYFDDRLTRIVMQKIAYFLQEIGVPFGVRFSRNEFGPYSDDMRKAFMTLERQGIIEGFTSDERESRVTQDGARLAREFLSPAEETRARLMIDRLDRLVEGYESPFGLEVLSSVHFIASHERVEDVDDIVRTLGEWSERKSVEFDPATIRQAHLRLQADQLLS